MKIVGCCIFIGCTTFLGLMKSIGLYERVRQLREYQNFLGSLSSEIQFHKVPLEEALIRVKDHPNVCLTEFLDVLVLCFNEQKWNRFSDLWCVAWERTQGAIKDSEEVRLMRTVGSNLGQGDLQHQQEVLKKTIDDLRKLEDEALSDYRIQGRMYCSIGLCSGIFLSVLLL